MLAHMRQESSEKPSRLSVIPKILPLTLTLSSFNCLQHDYKESIASNCRRVHSKFPNRSLPLTPNMLLFPPNPQTIPCCQGELSNPVIQLTYQNSFLFCHV